ncbi:MAG: TetR/AcrR family transcriptional regulator [Solirubrobacteraceae bacterium]
MTAGPSLPPKATMAAAKGGRYHHGDLRAALIDTAVGLIAERGVRNFSLAEASRRLGVSVSAPYAHFAGRDELLAAVTVHALTMESSALVGATEGLQAPADCLAAMARAYVRFAGCHRALFAVLSESGLDKRRHPEIEVAERPINDVFVAHVLALSDDPTQSEDLAIAVEATAHGHAMLLLEGDLGQGEDALEMTAERAARAILALIESRHLLSVPAIGAHRGSRHPACPEPRRAAP